MSPPLAIRLRSVTDVLSGTKLTGSLLRAAAGTGATFDIVIDGPAGAAFQVLHVNQYGYVTFGGHSSNTAIIYFDAPSGCPFIWSINAAEVMAIDPTRNLSIGGGPPGGWHSAVGTLWLTDATPPTAPPTSGGAFFWSAGSAFAALSPAGVRYALSAAGTAGGPVTQQVDKKAPSVVLSGTTTTTLLTYAVPDNTTLYISAQVTFDRTDTTTDAAVFTLIAGVKRRAGGIATLIGSPTSTALADAGLTAATCVVDVDGGNNLRIRCVGVSGATIQVFADVGVVLQAR